MNSTHFDSDYNSPMSDRLCEALESYGAKKQGDYTLEDYYALPDDVRVELIDGYFFEMEAPSYRHQAALFQLGFQFQSHINESNGNCQVFVAPCDVQLDMDDRTMVQPDVMVICDSANLSTRRYRGGPDLVIEVLSPSTRRKDTILKLRKYARAGVREYWIIDPMGRRVLVYSPPTDMEPKIYGFDASIPVGIWGGKYSIDFQKIGAALDRIPDDEA